MSRSGQEALFMRPEVQPESAHRSSSQEAAFTFIHGLILAQQRGRLRDVEVTRDRHGTWQLTPNGSGFDIDALFIVTEWFKEFYIETQEGGSKNGHPVRQFDVYSLGKGRQRVAQFWTQTAQKRDDTRPSSNNALTITPPPHERVTHAHAANIAHTALAYGR